MKKISVSVLVLIAMFVFVINFTACKNLSQDVLQANGHLTKANKLYKKENFKGAVVEYEEAFKKNPELKKLNLQLYIASCYSSMYKQNIQPPENQDLLDLIKKNAGILYKMKKGLAKPSEENTEGAEEATDPITEFKNIVIANIAKDGGLDTINEFLNNEEKGLSGLKDLANKFIENEKNIYAITNSYSPIAPDYRSKVEENVFCQLESKEINAYITANPDAEDVVTKNSRLDTLNAKIVENDTFIENTYIKNKDFYKVYVSFFPEDVEEMHKIFELVKNQESTKIYLNNKPIPYIQDLWLFLLWFYRVK